MNKRMGVHLDGLLWGAAAAGLLAGLSGCGGGLLLGIGTSSNDPPAVTLVAGAASGVRGNDLLLFADASDDDAVARVIFFQVEADGGELEVGRDDARPYTATAKLPGASFNASTVRYFARAVDSDDETTDSAAVSVELVNRP